MIMALASTDWLMAEGWRQGLFVHCIEEDVLPPLPFNIIDPPGCYPSRDVCKYSIGFEFGFKIFNDIIYIFSHFSLH